MIHNHHSARFYHHSLTYTRPFSDYNQFDKFDKYLKRFSILLKDVRRFGDIFKRTFGSELSLSAVVARH